MITLGRHLLVNEQHHAAQVTPHSHWGATLQAGLPAILAVSDTWNSRRMPALAVLQVLTGGPCLTLEPSTAGGGNSHAALSALRSQCSRENQALVCRLTDTCDLLLAPLPSTGLAPCAFWGYCVGRGALALGTALLEASRLPIVFDLDETLLVAYSLHTLDVRLEKLRDGRDRGAGAEEEAAALTSDRAMLHQFATRDSVTFPRPGGGMETVSASTEFVPPEGEGQPAARPVIRLPELGLVFTRIDAERRETSMIMHIRPGWSSLRAYLRPQTDMSTGRPLLKQRFEVYVCTAAERGYALEAWRILDPQAELISPEHQQQRIVSGKRRKTLGECLSVGSIPDRAADEEACTEPLEQDHPLYNSEVPLAIVLDDRLEVWDKRAQSQVLQVAPFLPRRARSATATAQEMAAEMERVQGALQDLRARLYWGFNEVLTPEMQKLPAACAKPGASLHAPTTLLPATPRISALLKACGLAAPRLVPQRTQQQPALDAGSRAQNLAALSHDAASLLPVDPRAARRQAAQAAAAAVSAKRGREDSPATADGASGIDGAAPAEGGQRPSQRQRTGPGAVSNGVNPQPAAGASGSGTPALPPGFEPPLGHGHPGGTLQSLQGAAAPPQQPRNPRLGLEPTFGLPVSVTPPAGPQQAPQQQAQQQPQQRPLQGGRPQIAAPAAAASLAGGLTPEQAKVLMDVILAAQANTVAPPAAPPQPQPPASAAAAPPQPQPAASAAALPPRPPPQLEQLQQLLRQESVQQLLQQLPVQQLPQQAAPAAQPQRSSHFDDRSAASMSATPATPASEQQPVRQGTPPGRVAPPARVIPMRREPASITPVQHNSLPADRQLPQADWQPVPPPHRHDPQRQPQSSPQQQQSGPTGGSAPGQASMMPPPATPAPGPAPTQRPPPSAQEVVLFIQALRRVLTEEEVADVQSALAGLLPAKRWPLIDQLRAEFLSEPHASQPSAAQPAATSAPAVDRSAGGPASAIRSPSAANAPASGASSNEEMAQAAQAMPPEGQPAAGTDSATAQLEAMLARLPAERVTAHDAAIQQLRPLLKRVPAQAAADLLQQLEEVLTAPAAGESSGAVTSVSGSGGNAASGGRQQPGTGGSGTQVAIPEGLADVLNLLAPTLSSSQVPGPLSGTTGMPDGRSTPDAPYRQATRGAGGTTDSGAETAKVAPPPWLAQRAATADSAFPSPAKLQPPPSQRGRSRWDALPQEASDAATTGAAAQHHGEQEPAVSAGSIGNGAPGWAGSSAAMASAPPSGGRQKRSRWEAGSPTAAAASSATPTKSPAASAEHSAGDWQPAPSPSSAGRRKRNRWSPTPVGSSPGAPPRPAGGGEPSAGAAGATSPASPLEQWASGGRSASPHGKPPATPLTFSLPKVSMQHATPQLRASTGGSPRQAPGPMAREPAAAAAGKAAAAGLEMAPDWSPPRRAATPPASQQPPPKRPAQDRQPAAPAVGQLPPWVRRQQQQEQQSQQPRSGGHAALPSSPPAGQQPRAPQLDAAALAAAAKQRLQPQPASGGISGAPSVPDPRHPADPPPASRGGTAASEPAEKEWRPPPWHDPSLAGGRFASVPAAAAVPPAGAPQPRTSSAPARGAGWPGPGAVQPPQPPPGSPPPTSAPSPQPAAGAAPQTVQQQVNTAQRPFRRPPASAGPPQKLTRTGAETGCANAMALLEEMAAQRNSMLQLQSWKEPDPSSSSKKRHIVNVLWNSKVVGSAVAGNLRRARRDAAEGAVERLQLFQAASSTLGQRTMARERVAAGKDISLADEPVAAALRDAAQAAFPGSRLQLCAYTNLAGYSLEHACEASARVIGSNGIDILAAGGWGATPALAVRCALHLMCRLMNVTPGCDIRRQLQRHMRGQAGVQLFDVHAKEVADATAHVGDLSPLMLLSHIQ